jgi:hypothetical protein
MKRFKIGFLAIIALVAMSFTLVSKADSKLVKAALVTGCFTQVEVDDNPYTDFQSPTGAASNPRDITDVPDVTSASGSVANFETECDGLEIFCCYHVENDVITEVYYDLD